MTENEIAIFAVYIESELKKKYAKNDFDIDVWSRFGHFLTYDNEGNKKETIGVYVITRTKNEYQHPGFSLVKPAFYSSALLFLVPNEVDHIEFFNMFIKRDQITFKQNSVEGLKFIRWGLKQNMEFEQILANITPVGSINRHIAGSADKKRRKAYSWLKRYNYVICTKKINYILTIEGKSLEQKLSKIIDSRLFAIPSRC